MKILKRRTNKGLEHRIYFYRDEKGYEVDVVFDNQEVLYPMENKSAMTWCDIFSRGIKWFQSAVDSSGKGTVIYSGDLEFEREDYSVRNFISDIS